MVVFTFTAQVLDMLLIKTTSYTLDNNIINSRMEW